MSGAMRRGAMSMLRREHEQTSHGWLEVSVLLTCGLQLRPKLDSWTYLGFFPSSFWGHGKFRQKLQSLRMGTALTMSCQLSRFHCNSS